MRMKEEVNSNDILQELLFFKILFLMAAGLKQNFIEASKISC
jgi:hypothetical protein